MRFCLGFGPRYRKCERGQIVQLAMRSFRVVVVQERAEPNARLSHRGEGVQVQTLVAHGSVEAFLLPVLPGLAWLNVQSLDAAACQSNLHSQCNELRPVVAAPPARPAHQ